ncbi:hypothetical protein LEP3755_09140 [Leptolyngbya sp. NIES-3755]|nr:hypothetical protein LEP3755_09140 [Leptolyngbya sp. NIES-3755]
MGEFDDDETYRYFNRQVVWKAFEECVRPIWVKADEEDEQERTFDLHSTNVDLWDQAIEGLMERFFWDRDWALTSQNPQLLVSRFLMVCFI